MSALWFWEQEATAVPMTIVCCDTCVGPVRYVQHKDVVLHGLALSHYALGLDAPNYPVPALREHVEILDSRVILWYRGHRDTLYLDYLATAD